MSARGKSSNPNLRYKGFFQHNTRQKEERREMLRVIETAQKLLTVFLDATCDCPRCLEKMRELLQ
jgi:hypothetical protein